MTDTITIPTPEAAAEAFLADDIEDLVYATTKVFANFLRGDRAVLAAKARELAEAADRELEVHDAQAAKVHPDDRVTLAGHEHRAYRCEGQAVALRAFAALLEAAK